MVSSFTVFVARGVEVSALDERLKAHVDFLEVKVEGSAAPIADASTVVAAEATQPSV